MSNGVIHAKVIKEGGAKLEDKYATKTQLENDFISKASIGGNIEALEDAIDAFGSLGEMDDFSHFKLHIKGENKVARILVERGVNGELVLKAEDLDVPGGAPTPTPAPAPVGFPATDWNHQNNNYTDPTSEVTFYFADSPIFDRSHTENVTVNIKFSAGAEKVKQFKLIDPSSNYYGEYHTIEILQNDQLYSLTFEGQYHGSTNPGTGMSQLVFANENDVVDVTISEYDIVRVSV